MAITSSTTASSDVCVAIHSLTVTSVKERNPQTVCRTSHSSFAPLVQDETIPSASFNR